MRPRWRPPRRAAGSRLGTPRKRPPDPRIPDRPHRGWRAHRSGSAAIGEGVSAPEPGAGSSIARWRTMRRRRTIISAPARPISPISGIGCWSFWPAAAEAEPISGAGRGGHLCADDLAPSRFLEIDWRVIAAAPCSRGSANSHVAILARARGVPLVIGLDLGAGQLVSGAAAILDAEQGRLIQDPRAPPAKPSTRACASARSRRRPRSRFLPRPAVDGVPAGASRSPSMSTTPRSSRTSTPPIATASA